MITTKRYLSTSLSPHGNFSQGDGYGRGISKSSSLGILSQHMAYLAYPLSFSSAHPLDLTGSLPLPPPLQSCSLTLSSQSHSRSFLLHIGMHIGKITSLHLSVLENEGRSLLYTHLLFQSTSPQK